MVGGDVIWEAVQTVLVWIVYAVGFGVAAILLTICLALAWAREARSVATEKRGDDR